MAAVCGLSSTLSFTTRRSSRSPASSSRCGATIRQGPHQGAQKSTSTGFGGLEHLGLEVVVSHFGDCSCHLAPLIVSRVAIKKYSDGPASLRHRAAAARAPSRPPRGRSAAVILELPSRRSRNRIGTSVTAEAGLAPPGRSARSGSRSRRRRRPARSMRLEHAPVKHLKPPVRSLTGTPSSELGRTRAAAADQAPRRGPSPSPRRRARSASPAPGRRRRRRRSGAAGRRGSWEKSESISITRSAPRVEGARRSPPGRRGRAPPCGRGGAPRPPAISAASRSAISPVPSGELSSTTRIVCGDARRRRAAAAPPARSARCSRPRCRSGRTSQAPAHGRVP